MERLAVAWGPDVGVLEHRLRDHHTGPPRWRIVRPKTEHVAIDGDDGPVLDRLDLVKSRSRLAGVGVIPEFAEHEVMLADAAEAVQAALGVSHDLKTTA